MYHHKCPENGTIKAKVQSCFIVQKNHIQYHEGKNQLVDIEGGIPCKEVLF